MTSSYDLIIVGAGIGGSCLASRMAQKGARVLLCEREPSYRDRVRGEGMHPWGVAELQRLGMLDAISQCATPTPRWQTYLGTALVTGRDLPSTTRDGQPSLGFYHPEMQQAALDAASSSGARVLRAASVREVSEAAESAMPSVSVEREGQRSEHRAKLVVVAAGRGSRLATALGRTPHAEPNALTVAGLLLEAAALEVGTIRFVQSSAFDRACIFFPLGRERVRAYAIQQHDDPRGLSGDARKPAFMELLRELDPAQTWLQHARASGPLASFAGAPQWIEPLYRNGVVLLGDAAGTVDPTFGCGLSMAARDARTLAQALCEHENADDAARDYAAQRARYHAAQRRIEGWLRAILLSPGPQGDAIRAQALPRMAAAPDLVGLGPDSASDDAAREALFGSASSMVA